MKIKAKKARLCGRVTVPGSKSHTIRALILATLADGVSHISNPLPSNDCLSTVKAIRQIGADADIETDPKIWMVRGAGDGLRLPSGQIDVGNSGSLMYFLCPVLSTLRGECVFTGDESIQKRPVSHLIDALNQLGASARCLKPGSQTPPFSFEGPVSASKTLFTDGKLSQYISGFMMASTRLDGTLRIQLSDPKETPYLTMTKLWLDSVGARVSISEDFKTIEASGPVHIKAFDKAVPSDWEGIAFPLMAALISDSEIIIENVDGSGSQGDDKLVEILQSVGADIVWDRPAQTLTVRGGKTLSTEKLPDKTLRVAVSGFPDAICALSTIACFIEGDTVISDIEVCRKKETDRIKAMISELSRLGGELEEDEDSLIIHGKGGRGMHGAYVESYKDHRIVMSLACLGLGLPAGDSLVVNDAEWCSVTFPGFFETMNALGAGFETV